MDNPNARLARLCEEYWEWLMVTHPTTATSLGDHRFNDRLEERGPDERARTERDRRRFLDELRAIPLASLAGEDRVTWDVLRIELETDLESRAYAFHEWDVDQMFGPQIWIQFLLEFHPQREPKDFRDLAARWEQFPRYIRQYLDDLRAGLRSGRVAAKISVERVLRQVQEVAATSPERTTFATVLEKAGGERGRLERAIRESLLPQYLRLAEFFEREYLPRAREAVGLSSLPGGREAYAFQIRHHTSLAFAPEELHRIGLEELEGNVAGMREIARRRGHTGELAGFLERVHQDRTHFFATREEILAAFRDVVARAGTRLPELFGDLPDIPCEVRPIEEYRERDAVAAFYRRPPDDRSRPGILYVNTHEPETRPKGNAAALAVHEGVPGHHFQIVLAMKQRNLPKIRRNGHSTAYVEGWAHYAELLGDEIGLYGDDMSRFGMLTEQAWRAARLVVDTGIHALGWTRERAIEFMRAHLALSEREILNEVDRYIIWPGQALAYKVGQREFRRLRALAKDRMGNRFDVRAFHDEVLRHGPVPLSTLARIVEDWAAGGSTGS